MLNRSSLLTLSGPAFFWVSHGLRGGEANLTHPRHLSPGVSEKLMLNMNTVTIFLRIVLRCLTFLWLKI